MMHSMGVAHASKKGVASQKTDGKPAVHETIVHHDVREAEERHSRANA